MVYLCVFIGSMCGALAMHLAIIKGWSFLTGMGLGLLAYSIIMFLTYLVYILLGGKIT